MEMLKFFPCEELLRNHYKPPFLCKTAKRNKHTSIEKRVMSQMQQVKTVKSLNKKTQNVPLLAITKIVGERKLEALPSDINNTLKLKLQKKQIRPANCYLKDSPLTLSPHRKDDMSELMIQVKIKQRIQPYDLSQKNLVLNFGKLQEKVKYSAEPRKKKSIRNLPCKIIMAKNSSFPLIDNLGHNANKSDAVSFKNIHNPQNNSQKAQLFDLSISRIEELPTPAFISKESYQQIAIFDMAYCCN